MRIWYSNGLQRLSADDDDDDDPNVIDKPSNRALQMQKSREISKVS